MARQLLEQLRSPLDDSDWLGDLERTEERCRSYLETVRWSNGVCCPRCESDNTGTIPARKRFYCRTCRYQFSVTSGTIFHNSHLPLWKWFLTVELLLDTETGLPANQLVHLLGGSYKTSWFVGHRIRAAILRTGERPAELYDDGEIIGTYHRPDAKYLHAYLAERNWRTRSRGNPAAFHRSLEMLLASGPVSYEELVGTRRGVAASTLTIS